jgi:hypothetical protein
VGEKVNIGEIGKGYSPAGSAAFPLIPFQRWDELGGIREKARRPVVKA